MAALAQYHDVCREVLGEAVLPADRQVVCGISLGWTLAGNDPRTEPGFFPTRLEVAETTTWTK